MRYKVFVSHSTRDMKLVTNIRDDLKKAGMIVYLAEEHLQPGKNLPQKIIDNIKSSDCMVVLLTYMGSRSQFVNQEIGAARMIKKPIIPMVERKIEKKVGGLLAGLEYILFDKANPKQAINKVASYVSHLKLRLESEIQKREEMFAMITAVVLLVLLGIILYFAFRKK